MKLLRLIIRANESLTVFTLHTPHVLSILRTFSALASEPVDRFRKLLSYQVLSGVTAISPRIYTTRISVLLWDISTINVPCYIDFLDELSYFLISRSNREISNWFIELLFQNETRVRVLSLISPAINFDSSARYIASIVLLPAIRLP